jgi:CheY-like chemotaxis protein
MAAFKNVCIIDDDDLFLILTRDIMLDESFAEQIHEFKDGREALGYLKSAAKGDFPEVLFLDINMPMLDGWEIMDAIKELDYANKMKVYITSSSINPVDLKKAEENPSVNGFLTKPLGPKKLKEIAEN